MADKTGKLDNVKSALSDGSTRLKYFAGVAISLVAAAIGGIFMLASGGKQSADVSEVPPAPTVMSTASESAAQAATPVYDNLLANENKEVAAEARRTGESAVPVLRSAAPVEQAQHHPVEPAPPAAPALPPPVPVAADQDRQREVQAITAAMGSQVNLLITAWAPKEHTSVAVHQTTKKEEARQDHPEGVQRDADQARTPVVRAGDILYAQLDTAINTDEPGPILATIVQDGALKGARLIGKVDVPKGGQKAILKFDLASIPNHPTSTAINAYAIDPETRRTAMASDVDNHYLLRYGTLFATSFLEGVGEFLLKGGQDERFIASNSAAVVQTDAYSRGELLVGGVTNIGKKLSNEAQKTIDRPPTITVNAGIGMGILFNADVFVTTR